MTIKTTRVVNKADESEEKLLIYTEWSHRKIKAMILRDSKTPLVGEAQFDDFDNHAKSFDKPLEQYIGELKDIFGNKDTEIDFYLTEDKLFWKRNKWALGRILIKPVTDIGIMAMHIERLIETYESIKYKESELERENHDLKLVNSQITNQLSKMVALKSNLESSVYKKCILLVNSKKERIRNLKSKSDMNNKDGSVYDASTDESENELKLSTESKITKKRLLEHNENLTEEKKQKSEISESKAETTRSCIKDSFSTVFQEDEETPDFMSDESVCEMELKLDEEGAVNQEQSSEEMF